MTVSDTEGKKRQRATTVTYIQTNMMERGLRVMTGYERARKIIIEDFFFFTLRLSTKLKTKHTYILHLLG